MCDVSAGNTAAVSSIQTIALVKLMEVSHGRRRQQDLAVHRRLMTTLLTSTTPTKMSVVRCSSVDVASIATVEAIIVIAAVSRTAQPPVPLGSVLTYLLGRCVVSHIASSLWDSSY